MVEDKTKQKIKKRQQNQNKTMATAAAAAVAASMITADSSGANGECCKFKLQTENCCTCTYTMKLRLHRHSCVPSKQNKSWPVKSLSQVVCTPLCTYFFFPESRSIVKSFGVKRTHTHAHNATGHLCVYTVCMRNCVNFCAQIKLILWN